MSGSESISVDQLVVGMYVSQLDRPWLETPFLFQGFHLSSEDEIAEIRRYCKFVVVDHEQSELRSSEPAKKASQALPADDRNADEKSENTFIGKITRRFVKKSPVEQQSARTVHEQSHSLQDELAPATESHDQALVAIQNVFAKLRDKKSLDIPSLTTVVDPMIDSVLRNRDALACLARMKSKTDYLYSHSLGTAVWALVLGRHLGLDRETLLVVGLGAMLLDVGMTQVPTDVLTKPGKPSPAEQKMLQGHVEIGLKIIEKEGPVDPRVLEMVANHHERHNGTGYPNGIAGSAIPVYGRIAGLADCYDAMITERPYAPAISSLDAMQQLRHRANVDFQTEMVDQFMQAIGAFPTGTLIELNTGEVGIVIAQNNFRRLLPTVMMVLDASKQPQPDSPVIDLALQNTTEDGSQSLWIAKGLEPGAFGIDPVKYYVG